MRVKHKRGILMALVMMCILCFSVVPIWAESQGTDGTELQVAQPEQLEIQLGSEWAGVEFQMKTDAGLYPGTIPVGQDGVLRLEIGGSKSYVLTCMNSTTKSPSPTRQKKVQLRSQAFRYSISAFLSEVWFCRSVD